MGALDHHTSDTVGIYCDSSFEKKKYLVWNVILF